MIFFPFFCTLRSSFVRVHIHKSSQIFPRYMRVYTLISGKMWIYFAFSDIPVNVNMFLCMNFIPIKLVREAQMLTLLCLFL